MKIIIEYDKSKEVKTLKSDNYEIHIDDIDKNIFKIECIEFKNCSFKDIYFESFEDKRQNVVLLISVSQDNNEIQRSIKPDFKSKTTKENLCYPRLYFEACKFEYFEIKKAEIDHEKNENASREYINSHVFALDAFFNYDLHVKACEFDFGFELLDAQVKSNITFEDITFSKTFKISGSNFNKNIKFKKITFDKVVLMSNSYEEIQMEKVDFKNDILFFSNEIIKSAFFKGVTVEKIEKDNTVEFYFRCKENSEINFTKCCFYRRINFIGKFDNTTLDIDNGNIFYENVLFKDIKFKNKQILSVNQFKKEVSFFGVKFDDGIEIKDDFLKTKNISFKSCEFNQVIAFENKTIKNLTFGTCVFNKGVYFVFCNFFDVKIYSCSFNQPASFYGSTFNMVPNFSQSIFKDNFNALNITLNFTFDNLKKQIEQEYENFNKDKNEQYQKSLDKFANDFRDSFRVFKNALIKDNNLLEASKFHKYELYCKEIELKENQNKKDEYVENVIDVEKNMWRVRELVDFLLLGFYRKLCDHHTDVFKVFNNLILLVALYVLFSSSFIWAHSDKLKDTRAILTVYEFFDGLHSYVDKGVVIFFILGCMFALYKLKAYESKNKILNKQKINFIYIIKDFCNFIKSLFLAVFIPCVFYVILGQIFSLIFNLDKYSLFVNTLFVSLYICVVYTKSLFFGRYVVLILSYMYFFVILIEQPSAIHPLIGKITNEPDKNFNYPSLMTLYILYTILVALVIFSLQKTARKNSIVPS
ncbi:A24 family peptidase [Campylobacter lari]|nr:A24 family peptidase [Campylobacter lari]